MNTGEQIRAFRVQVQELREELRQTESSLRECEASCTHENTQESIIVFLPNSSEPFGLRTLKCLDCGVYQPVLKRGPKKAHSKKV